MGIARALKLKSLTTNHIKSSDQVHLAQHISERRTTTGTMRKHNNHNNAPNVASMTAIVLLATSFKCVSATFTYIAGYEPRSTVTTHAQIDLDAKDIIKHADWPKNNGAAYKDCAANACNWDGAAMYPSSDWDGSCTHDMVIPASDVDGSNEKITFTAHGLSNGDKVKYYKGTGVVISNLVHKTEYFVKGVETDKFQLSSTADGNPIDLGTPGGDDHYFTKNRIGTSAKCATPYGIYTKGKNSLKSVAVRSIAGFASSIGTKTSGPVGAKVAAKDNQFIGAMNKFWKIKGLSETTWAEDIIEAAFKGEKVKDSDDAKNKFDFGVVGRDFRKEVIQKGMIYLNIFPYVIWEMQDAINDCKAGDLTANAESGEGSASVHAWDEAVAFYTGSLELTTKGGLTGYKEDGVTGYLQYYLADKRCENFGTCTASYDTNPDDLTGESKVNEEIITLFQRGENEIAAAVTSTSSTKCDVPAKTMEEISTKMLVPFIQGTIRYLHKTELKAKRKAKEVGELFAFASTILPFIHAVDPATATMLYNHVWEMPTDPASDANTVATIKSAMEATYPKLGFGAGIGTLKCSDIGSLHNGGNLQLSGCVDTTSSNLANFAGYEPITDVTMHSRIDLDLEAITSEANIGGTCSAGCKLSDCAVATTVMAEGTGCNYDGTTLSWPTTADGSVDIWTNGEYSTKATSMRTIKGFASGAKEKESSNSPATKDVAYKANKFIAIMNKYWKSKNLDEHTWGVEMIKAAFDGTKVGTNAHLDFSTVGRDFRKEAIQKGIVYMNIFPYVTWELQDAVNDCNAFAGTANDDASVHAWDEAVAFYAGSKTRGIGYGASGGNLQYALADKRCKNFKTCADGFTGVSKVNQDIFALFNLGKVEARKMSSSATTADCALLNALKEKITTLSLVPFVQGTLRYLYKTRNDDSGRSAKQVGELWAFASAILPFVHEVDANAAEMLYRRAWQLDFTTDSYEAIKTALEATYPKLGAGAGVGLVTCEAVGDLYSGSTDDTLLSAGTCYP